MRYKIKRKILCRIEFRMSRKDIIVQNLSKRSQVRFNDVQILSEK